MSTKTYWINSLEEITSQRNGQILKNTGYINIQLRSVYYKSKGNIWQNTFGGSDKVVLSTNVKYQNSGFNVESSSIQDIRHVKVNRECHWGLQRNIAIKIPAHADALEFEVQITGIKKDKLEEAFNMLNSPEYQAALELAPQVVGQVITVTSLIKKLFTESEMKDHLKATYAGIISSENETNPVGTGRLTQGFLILIYVDDDPNFFENVDESKFSLQGNMAETLYYDGKKLENSTYIVFLISFENNRGGDEKSEWHKKYREALSHLDRLYIPNIKERENILEESTHLWLQGSALLEVDHRYLNREKVSIKGGMIEEISKKYLELTEKFRIPLVAKILDLETLNQISGSATPEEIRIALPSTASYLNKTFNFHKNKPYDYKKQPKIVFKSSEALGLLNKDKNIYLDDLKSEGKSFSLFDSST